MIGNIKEIFLPKTGLQEKQVLQDPGYVEGVKTTCCMLHGMLQGCTKYPMSKESKEIKIAIIQYERAYNPILVWLQNIK